MSLYENWRKFSGNWCNWSYSSINSKAKIIQIKPYYKICLYIQAVLCHLRGSMGCIWRTVTVWC